MRSRARTPWCALAIGVASTLLASCSRRAQYFADGTKRFEGTTRVHTWVEDGSWSSWFPNGERRESGTYENGRRVGVWTQWYPRGQRRSQGERVWNEAVQSSPREGAWTFWYESGEIESRGIYRAGRREGLWEFSHDDGGLDGDRSGPYHDDRRIDG